MDTDEDIGMLPPAAEVADDTLKRMMVLPSQLEHEPKCPFCQTDKWTIQTFMGLQPHIPVGGLGIGTLPGYAVYVLVCDRCGFVRLQSKQKIDDTYAGQDGS